MTSASRMMSCDNLDAIIAAVEAGMVCSSPGFVSQWNGFCTQRMVDRWYGALRHRIGRQDQVVRSIRGAL